jgi:hypothetical protein
VYYAIIHSFVVPILSTERIEIPFCKMIIVEVLEDMRRCSNYWNISHMIRCFCLFLTALSSLVMGFGEFYEIVLLVLYPFAIWATAIMAGFCNDHFYREVLSLLVSMPLPTEASKTDMQLLFQQLTSVRGVTGLHFAGISMVQKFYNIILYYLYIHTYCSCVVYVI